MGSVRPTNGVLHHRTHEVSSEFFCSAALNVLTAVNTAVVQFETKNITTVGHSLGKSSVMP